MINRFIFLHGAFQSPYSWRIPRDFPGYVHCVDCSTLELFQRDLDKVLRDIEGEDGRIVVVATSLGCIHGIRLANQAVSNSTSPTTLVFCAVPGMVTRAWQTILLTKVLTSLNFLRWLPFPKWLARKIWTTPEHRENLNLLSADIREDDLLLECIPTHIIFTFFDFLAGTKKRQKAWVQVRSKSTLLSQVTLFTHYPYIFDRRRFWKYLEKMSTEDV